MPDPIRSVDAARAADGMRPRPRVVVVGTGLAGLEAVRALRKAPVDVVLVDRNNYHKFQPLLYQVGTAGLQPGEITQPARHIFQGRARVQKTDTNAYAIWSMNGQSRFAR